ncbi:MAG TPA: 3'-5' exonuclease, partial [Candidatus Binataceae bacterium]
MSTLLAIYPTARKVESLLKRESLKAPMLGHSTMTFPQLIDALWRECSDNKIVIGPVGERLTIEAAVERAREQKRFHFETTPGLIPKLAGSIRQLKSASLQASDLLQRGDSANEKNSTLSANQWSRIESLTAVFGEYDSILARRGLADSHDRERAVLDSLLEMESRGTRPEFLRDVKSILIAEIYDLSLLQFMIASALIRMIGDARLTIQAQERSVDAQRFAHLTWNRFVQEQSIADQVLPDFVRRGGRTGQLGFLLENIFVEKRAAAPAYDGTVRIIEAPTPRAEAYEVGRAIRLLLERTGADSVPIERIAIVARDIGAYAEHLENVMREYRIPMRLTSARPLSASAPARLAIEILRVPGAGYPRVTVTKLIDSPLLSIAARQHRRILQDSGYIDRKTRPLEKCLEQFRTGLEEELARIGKGAPEREALELKLKRFGAATSPFNDVFAKLESLDREATISEHVRNLEAVLGAFNLNTVLRRRTDGSVYAASALLTTLQELAREFALLDPEHKPTLDKFADLAQSALAETFSETEPQPERAVQAFSVIDGRGLDFDAVFVIGLNDGGFPIYHEDDPILPDDLKLALNPTLAGAIRRRYGKNAPSWLGRILRTRYDRNGEDPFLFFLALSMPEREIVLSYAAAGADGSPLLPSPFITEVFSALGYAAGPKQILHRVSAGEIVPALDRCFSRGELLNWASCRADFDADLISRIADGEERKSIRSRGEIERARERFLMLPAREERENPDGTYDPLKLKLATQFDGL